MNLDLLGFNKVCLEYFASISEKNCFPSRVTFASRGRWRLAGEFGDTDAVLPGKARQGELFTPPVVGDWVLAERVDDSLAIIRDLMPRMSVLARGGSGDRTRRERAGLAPQPLAANVTKCFIVCGLDRDFNVRRIERYLALAYGGGVTPVILLNKADLAPDPALAANEVADIAPDVDIVPLCALDGTDVEVVRSLVDPGDTVCFVGSSGAGKSTLINALVGAAVKSTGEVSAFSGKGRHTTSDRELFALSGGGVVIDTPGLREVGVICGVEETFPEIEQYAANCKFKDCAHQGEPGCAVARAVEEGIISPERWESYLKLKREAAFRHRVADASAAAAEKKKWKSVSKDIKRFYRME